SVTGVQTCALPIWICSRSSTAFSSGGRSSTASVSAISCRRLESLRKSISVCFRCFPEEDAAPAALRPYSTASATSRWALSTSPLVNRALASSSKRCAYSRQSLACSPPWAASARAFKAGRDSSAASAMLVSRKTIAVLRKSGRILLLHLILLCVSWVKRYQPVTGLPFLIGKFARVGRQETLIIFHRLLHRLQVVKTGGPQEVAGRRLGQELGAVVERLQCQLIILVFRRHHGEISIRVREVRLELHGNQQFLLRLGILPFVHQQQTERVVRLGVLGHFLDRDPKLLLRFAVLAGLHVERTEFQRGVRLPGIGL